MNNLQINVLSSEACKNRITVIKETWGKYFSNIVFYADFEEIPNVVKCTNISTAVGNEEKILNRIKQIKNNNTYTWYFFVDDDTFINANNLLTFIKNADLNKTYGRVIGGWGISYYQGGGGSLISGHLIDKIRPETLHSHGSTFSDVLFGQILNNNNLELVHVDEFYDRSPQSYNLNQEQIKNAITFHQVANTMLDLYQEIY